MEEIIRNLGVKIESIFMSLFVALIIVILRIYEPETPPSHRKIVYLFCAGLATAVLVPGLVVRWMKEDNAYMSGFYTAIIIWSFEIIMKLIQDLVIKRFNGKNDGTSNGNVG